jgi:hypothetical protein
MTLEYQILDHEDALALISTLESTEPHQDVAGVRIHKGICFADKVQTIVIELNNAQSIVIG